MSAGRRATPSLPGQIRRINESAIARHPLPRRSRHDRPHDFDQTNLRSTSTPHAYPTTLIEVLSARVVPTNLELYHPFPALYQPLGSLVFFRGPFPSTKPRQDLMAKRGRETSASRVVPAMETVRGGRDVKRPRLNEPRADSGSGCGGSEYHDHDGDSGSPGDGASGPRPVSLPDITVYGQR